MVMVGISLAPTNENPRQIAISKTQAPTLIALIKIFHHRKAQA